MRIEVDWDACEGHGQCCGTAPAVFTLDDDGYLSHHYEDADIPPEHEGAARAAVDVCPVLALRARA